ncbi:site-specific DNA-methyltransferase [Erythrobacter colymbi]|uniref:site-specific DNA-methyltransferase n=1 Tax=Erythrobacter colymbi TaxID=1161202 RepID=UPI001980BB4C|nr:site-specific DNA-methyltransferase [Erythrobacter colymbi]
MRDLILAHVPEDGSAIGNMALLALLREQVPGLSDEEYAAAKDDLVAEGLLGKGRGRGGSVFLASIEDDEDGEDDGEDFALEAQEPGVAVTRRAAGKKKAPAKAKGPVQVLSYRHDDTRVNNPEVGMVHPDNDPDQPKTVWAYDPHLDPALMFDSQRGAIETLIDDALASGDADVMADALAELKRMQAPYLNWTGKAERTSFEVDTVSLHVHERVDPATILARAAKRLKGGKGAEEWRQADLFAAPFENLPLRKAVDFYKHEKGWSNRLIAGDSLLVMNSLLQKESMAGKVQMIYIDPPYGIKYGSNFQPFTNKKDVKDRVDADLTQEPEMIKAFRDTWELGIHSYLTYLRDRLRLARELLSESGSLFVQISEENVHLVRGLLDEIFGQSNFFADIIFVKAGALGSVQLPRQNDYIIWYCKDKRVVKYNQLYFEKIPEEDVGAYRLAELPNGEIRGLKNGDDLSKVRPLRYVLMTKPGPGQKYSFDFQGRPVDAGDRWWGFPPESMPRLIRSGRIAPSGRDSKRYLDDFPATYLSNLWTDTATGSGMGKVYVVQTNEKVVERCLLMCTEPGDLVLDPTCGSGTTAVVSERWGRRWITCDTSRVAITLAKQRLMTASFDYFALRYPNEGLKGGFIYQTVPHITLKSIANNPDIDTIYEAEHPSIATALDGLNASLLAAPPASFKPGQGYRKGKPVTFAAGEGLEEWEVPFDFPAGWPDKARKPFDDFHTARRTMQAAMDQSIKDRAEQETLYDKPKKDDTRLRITGPFSVEAVPAPTVLSLDETVQPAEADATVARSGETSRQTQWRDELIRTGIRAKGGAMLKFADLETIPGVRHLHASGTLAETGERVVVSFGPEHAALEQRQVEMALSEAEKLRPAPKFIVFCAFTFDPEAAKDIDEINWPGVTLLKAQMNTDLLTEDLKKARSSNQSFWLMGQPEVELRQTGDTWQVEVHGFDYFDPREGTLVSGGKSKIAMWSLDTDYDGRSLMPHQVFFPMAGAKDGWNRLKKTIRAELDEDLLEQFHGTVSLPFEAGDHRRIAVKIVDDRGIESLKIMDLG